MKNKLKVTFCLLLAVFMVFSSFSVLFSVNSAEETEEDESKLGIFCGGVYHPGFFRNSFMTGNTILPELGNRNYTFEEMFGESLKFSVFQGEREAATLLKARDAGLGEVVEGPAKDRLVERGNQTWSVCVSGPIFAGLASGIISISSAIASLTNSLITSLFDTESAMMSSVITIVGGESNSDGGVIRTLSTGIYYPFMILAVVVAATYVGYKGIVQRKFRETIQALLWILVALVLGVLIAERPALIAQAPQQLTSVATGCIMDGFNGRNCLDGSSTVGTSDSSTFTSDICLSVSSQASASQRAVFNMNGLSCGIWRGLVLNTWSKAQFGYTFDELYTSNPPAGKEVYNLPDGVSPDDFCVGVYSSQSPNSLKKSWNNRVGAFTSEEGRKVCNVAAYHLAVTSGMLGLTENDKIEMANKVAIVALNDDAMFDSWGRLLGTISQSVVSVIGSLFTLLAIFSITLKAHVYLFLSTVGLAFGPVFALFALHPGRGKKLFLGWVESIIGYILKFIAAVAIIMVTVMLFSAVLSEISGVSALFVCIILSAAMKTYQSQFVSIIGKVELGGQKIANDIDEKIFNKASEAKSKVTSVGSAAAGTLVGAKLAASLNGVNTGDTIRERASYYGDALKQSAVRGMNRSGNKLVKSSSREFLRQDNRIDSIKREELRASREYEDIAAKQEGNMDAQDAMTNALDNMSENVEALIDDKFSSEQEPQKSSKESSKDHSQDSSQYPRKEYGRDSYEDDYRESQTEPYTPLRTTSTDDILDQMNYSEHERESAREDVNEARSVAEDYAEKFEIKGIDEKDIEALKNLKTESELIKSGRFNESGVTELLDEFDKKVKYHEDDVKEMVTGINVHDYKRSKVKANRNSASKVDMDTIARYENFDNNAKMKEDFDNIMSNRIQGEVRRVVDASEKISKNIKDYTEKINNQEDYRQDSHEENE